MSIWPAINVFVGIINLALGLFSGSIINLIVGTICFTIGVYGVLEDNPPSPHVYEKEPEPVKKRSRKK